MSNDKTNEYIVQFEKLVEANKAAQLAVNESTESLATLYKNLKENGMLEKLVSPIEEALPSLIGPLSSEVFTTEDIVFNWNIQDVTTDYYRVVTTTGEQGTGTVIYDSGQLASTVDSVVITMPTDGSTVYTTLSFTKGGLVQAFEYSHVTWTAPVAATPPRISNVSQGDELVAAQIFNIQAETLENVEGYWIIIGTAPGGADIVNSKFLPPETTSFNPDPDIVHSVDTTLHMRFSYSISGTWTHVDTTHPYTAPEVVGGGGGGGNTNNGNSIHDGLGVLSSISGLTASGPINQSNKTNFTLENKSFTQALTRSKQSQVKYTDCSNFTIKNNLVQGTPNMKENEIYGIHLEKCHDFVLELNDIWDFYNGLRINNCYNYTIKFNTVHDCHQGAINQVNCVARDGDCIVENNHCFNSWNHTAAGDMIATWRCVGNANGGFHMRNNYCHMWDYWSAGTPQGIYEVGANGGGVMVADGGDRATNLPQQYIYAYDNIVINCGHYGVSISGGRRCRVERNGIWVGEYNRNRKAGIGLSILNQSDYDSSKINTGYGEHVAKDNRVHGVGTSTTCQLVTNHKFFKSGVIEDSGNLYGPGNGFTQESLEAEGRAKVAQCRIFDHPFVHTPRLEVNTGSHCYIN